MQLLLISWSYAWLIVHDKSDSLSRWLDCAPKTAYFSCLVPKLVHKLNRTISHKKWDIYRVIGQNSCYFVKSGLSTLSSFLFAEEQLSEAVWNYSHLYDLSSKNNQDSQRTCKWKFFKWEETAWRHRRVPHSCTGGGVRERALLPWAAVDVLTGKYCTSAGHRRATLLHCLLETMAVSLIQIYKKVLHLE